MTSNLRMLILAVLLKRLGGEAKISQSDIDEVAYGKITEEWEETGSYCLRYTAIEKMS